MEVPQINPIFLRVLTSSGRLARHVWVRVGYLVAILITLIIILLVVGLDPAELGEQLFRAVSYAQLILILLLAPIYTAGAISQERDSQTFSVLLATPLSNLQIVLGSLSSRLFFVLAILFSTLPLFALLYYFGGFELKDVILSYGIAATSALLTGSIAIAISIAYTGTRRVMIGFFLFITAYLVGIWGLDHWILPRMGIAGYPPDGGLLDWLHPIGAIQSTLMSGQKGRPLLGDVSFTEFWTNYPEYGYLIYSTVISVIILILAAVFVRRLARGYGGLARRISIILTVVLGVCLAAGTCAVLVRTLGRDGGLTAFGLLAGLTALTVWFFLAKRHRKPRPVWDNPIAWRERVTRTATGKRSLVQFFYILFAVLALYAVLVMKVTGFSAGDARWFVFAVTIVQMFVMLVVGATLAATCISYEREDGTLDLLLATPITPRYFIAGKVWGIIRYLGMFLGMMLLVTLGALLVARLPVEDYLAGLVPKALAAAVKPAAGPIIGGNRATWADWPLVSVTHPLIVAGALAAAMVTVGMTFSLKAKKSGAAALYSALVVLGYSLLVTCCCFVTSWVPLAGWVAAFASPFMAMYACIMPEAFYDKYAGDAGDLWYDVYRYAGIHVGALVAAVGYGLFAWFRLRAMVRTFDQQTRRKT